MDILSDDDRDERSERAVLRDRRQLVNLDFEPFDDSDSPEDVRMFEPGDIPD